MNDKQQIEEMYFDLYSKRVEYDIETKSGCEDFAKELVDKGWVKLPENSVVLTREEWARLKGIEKLLDMGYFTTENRKVIHQARKETAREILAKLQGMGKIHTEFDWNDYLEIDIDDFYKLAKEYGVE